MDGEQEKKSYILCFGTTFATLNFSKEHQKKPNEYMEHVIQSGDGEIKHVCLEPDQDYHSECTEWGCDDMELHECKQCWGDDIYRWHCEWLWTQQIANTG